MNWDRFCSMLVETRVDFRHRPYRTVRNLDLSLMDSASEALLRICIVCFSLTSELGLVEFMSFSFAISLRLFS